MDQQWRTGGCFCGEVRYRVRGQTEWKAGCTCNTCVRMHGAPYVVWAGFDQRDYELTGGELAEFASSDHVLRGFCRRCGTTLTYRKVAEGEPELERAARIVYVAVATLDDPEAYPPDEVVHAGERIGWLDLGDGMPLRDDISPTAGHLQFGGIYGDRE
ncbi:MAG: GFA family protein [Alphaproteobacteria bacterium]|jgi:hypothetical protein|nr:GFA family protein [Alphaproteobacteria bacterium]